MGPMNKAWIPLTDFINPAYWDWSGTDSIALDRNDPERLYLAVGMYTASWSMNGGFLVSTNRAGDLWLGGDKLYHSKDFGKTWAAVGPPSLESVNQLALGMPAPRAAYQTIFINGNVNGKGHLPFHRQRRYFRARE